MNKLALTLKNVVIKIIKFCGVVVLFLLFVICFALAVRHYDRYADIKKCVNEGYEQQWCEEVWEEIDKEVKLNTTYYDFDIYEDMLKEKGFNVEDYEIIYKFYE